MALINCKECGHKISKKAESCPGCGAVLKKPSSSNSLGCGCLVVLLFIAFLAYVMDTSIDNSGSSSGSNTTPRPEHSATEAWVMCQVFVERQLKAPSSAEYPRFQTDRYVTSLGDGMYLVDAYVDAQNSFGAQIRNNFTCRIKYAGNERWTLEDLTIE